MPDRRTTRADTTNVKRDRTEEMPPAEAAPRTEQQQPIGEQKVLETVEGIMEKLSLFMNHTNQSSQVLDKILEHMESQGEQILKSILVHPKPLTTRTIEEVFEETSKETVLHRDDIDQVDEETSEYDHEAVLEEYTGKVDGRHGITEDIISNIDATDQIDEEEISLDHEETIQNDADKDQDDKNAYVNENIIRKSFGPSMISHYLTDDKFPDDSNPKNV